MLRWVSARPARRALLVARPTSRSRIARSNACFALNCPGAEHWRLCTLCNRIDVRPCPSQRSEVGSLGYKLAIPKRESPILSDFAPARSGSSTCTRRGLAAAEKRRSASAHLAHDRALAPRSKTPQKGRGRHTTRTTQHGPTWGPLAAGAEPLGCLVWSGVRAALPKESLDQRWSPPCPPSRPRASRPRSPPRWSPPPPPQAPPPT